VKTMDYRMRVDGTSAQKKKMPEKKPKGTDAKFWDRIAERYAKSPIADEAAYQRKLEVTRQYFRPDAQVLEIGCGTGSTAILHAPFVKHIRALDISQKMIEIAQGKAKEAHVENVTFEQSDIDAFSAPDRSYDAVLGLSILHLLVDRDAAIAKVHRMLKPGGVFVTSTACLGETLKVFKLIGPVGRFFGLIPMVKVFTVQDLVNSLTRAGFAIDHQWQPDKGRAVFIVAKKGGVQDPHH